MNRSISDELNEYIRLTYRYSRKTNPESSFLKESFGVPTDIDLIANVFSKYVHSKIDFMIHHKIANTELTTNETVLKEKYGLSGDLFFKNLNVNISVCIGQSHGGYLGFVEKSDNFVDDKIKDCEIQGNIRIDENNIESSINVFVAMFAHELLHAFESLQRHISGRESLRNNAEKYGYFSNTEHLHGIVRCDFDKLSNIVYTLTPIEIRAYCTQIIKQIEPELANCKTSTEAIKLINKTGAWRKYQRTENWIDEISTGNIECSEKDVENWWKKITGERRSFNRIIKRLKEKMERAKQQIINNVCKKVADCALSKNDWNFLTVSDDEV